MLRATFISKEGLLNSSQEADLVKPLRNHDNWDFKVVEGGHWPMLTIPDELSTLLLGVSTAIRPVKMEFDLPFTEAIAYEALLARAKKNYDSFSLVWRAGMNFNSHAEEKRKTLAEFLIKEERRSVWPVTESSGEPSMVSEYKVCKRSIAVLSETENLWS